MCFEPNADATTIVTTSFVKALISIELFQKGCLTGITFHVFVLHFILHEKNTFKPRQNVLSLALCYIAGKCKDLGRSKRRFPSDLSAHFLALFWGPVARHVWYDYWNHQADLFCDQPAAQVTRRAGLYRCYVCKQQHWTNRDGVELRRCLICRNVFMCPRHWIRPACLDTDVAVVCCRHTRLTPGPGSWNPIGYYPILEAVPTKRHLQERWQDEDHVVPARVASHDPEHPEVKRRVPYRIWGDPEASSTDSESGP
eukprot:4722461-Amphidinium_carterae.1